MQNFVHQQYGALALGALGLDGAVGSVERLLAQGLEGFLRGLGCLGCFEGFRSGICEARV